MTRMLVAVAVIAGLGGSGMAAVKSKKVEYKYDGVTFAGELYWDDAGTGKRPGVLVFHEWWGLDAHAKAKAEELAKLGYVAFAADMYGDGKVAEHPTDAGKMATAVRANVDVWRGRAKEALKVLTADEHVDATKVAAIGYCFGGTTAIQLAASGADVKAVSTFHAALPKLKDDEAKAIKAKVLVNHGADDKFIPAEAIAAFQKAMADAKVSLDFREYKGAVHSFTVKTADEKKLDGMKYDKDADEKSWSATKTLFAEAFKK
ncbi:MAG: dienelactone hydrolase family protein [Fimbriiglobus sp.]|nr:dienelactone hydrolase family protein [Fimbriiglobus sp.]